MSILRARYLLFCAALMCGVISGFVVFSKSGAPVTQSPAIQKQASTEYDVYRFGHSDADTRAGSVTVATGGLAPPARTVARPPPVTLVPSAVLNHEHYLWLEEHFENEPIDEAWAESTQSRIFNAIADSDIGVNTAIALCRSTICRVELAFTEDYEVESIIAKIVSPVIGSGSRLNHVKGYQSGLPQGVEASEGVHYSGPNIGIFYLYSQASVALQQELREVSRVPASVGSR